MAVLPWHRCFYPSCSGNFPMTSMDNAFSVTTGGVMDYIGSEQFILLWPEHPQSESA